MCESFKIELRAMLGHKKNGRCCGSILILWKIKQDIKKHDKQSQIKR